ncbi:cytochrome C [Novosphingobium sp. RD2P27]|uniref:Cytochrome C n=1 Tax=Novosphingobium kalidii TaxID=3230299 RepID=A0ABV2D590_9SPHN
MLHTWGNLPLMTFRRFLVFGCTLLAACGQGATDKGDSVPAMAGTAPVTAGLSPGEGRGEAPDPPAAFAVCRSCHTVTPGRHGAGPSLAGVWGAKAGSLPGYAYSEALKSSGIVWDAETLDTWLQAPTKMVPGTRMIIGIPNAEARKAVIEYLEALK